MDEKKILRLRNHCIKMREHIMKYKELYNLVMFSNLYELLGEINKNYDQNG